MTTAPPVRTDRSAHEVIVDPGRWPDVARVPHAPVKARIAKRILDYGTKRAGVRLHYGGEVPPARERTGPMIVVHDEAELLARLGADRLVGFGEAWMSGAWDTDDLPTVLMAFAEELTELVPPSLQRLRRWLDTPFPADEHGEKRDTRRNVARHYDLSNDLFATFLDPTMTYSSALFGDGDDLERAQVRKIDTILDAAGVQDGTDLLEIGSGWGALAVRAAERGASVTTVTLSQGQKELTEQRAREAGVADRIEVRLQDYRDVEGRFPSIVSVEMIEAVGERHWPSYFGALGRLLAPGGRIGLQSITMPHDHMMATKRSWTWIHKYIFPGGLIPSVRSIDEHAHRNGLRIAEERTFGADYAETLRQWREQFAAASDRMADLGFDDVFHRMWDFYLAYCEAGFRAGRIGVSQFTVEEEAR